MSTLLAGVENKLFSLNRTTLCSHYIIKHYHNVIYNQEFVSDKGLLPLKITHPT